MHTDQQQPFFKMIGPAGEPISIPARLEDDHPYFAADELEQAKAYYAENGYVVVRKLLPESLCRRVAACFDEEVRQYSNFLYRQTTGNPERHKLSDEGYILNPLLNLQDLSPSDFGRFRDTAFEVIAGREIQSLLEKLFDEPATLVQSMFFDGNPETWAHQDTYYLDSTAVGRMTAAWFAMENIDPGAGRFFVYPKSHLLKLPEPAGETSYSYNHERYKAVVRDVIRTNGLGCRAPALQAGDVLLWHPSTIHGSLCTANPSASRRSFTGHYIPNSTGLLQFRTRERRLALRMVNGMQVNHPKAQDRLINQIIFFVETRAPRQFQALKRLATKLLVG